MIVKEVCREERINTNSGVFVVRKEGDLIKEVFYDGGVLLLKANEGQTIEFLTSTWSGDAGTMFRAEDTRINIMVNIFEPGKKTLLYDLNEKKELTKSLYEDSTFSCYNGWVIERTKDGVKAIYDLSGKLVLKVEKNDHNLEFDGKNDCIKEIFSDGKCHKIYIEEKDDKSANILFKCLYYSRVFEEISLIKEPVIEGVGKVASASVLIGTYKGVNRIIRIL